MTTPSQSHVKRAGDSSMPERVIFNFLERCNMSCPYCYCPFDGRASDITLWKRIVDRLAQWDVKSITFGGGDPFLYRRFSELLRYAREASSSLNFVQVDTNGYGLRRHDYSDVRQFVDLLGLPLDGADSGTHGTLRADARHFDLICRLIHDLSTENIQLKVNTFVCTRNVEQLTAIATLLEPYNVRIWSLYQAWSLGPGADYVRGLALPEHRFLTAARAAQRAYSKGEVEIGSINYRKRSYFFVSQTGRCYTIHREDSSKYVDLGNVFDNSVLDKWHEHCSPEIMRERIQRRTTLTRKT